MSKPNIKPLGIGDLMIVKQTLARYAPGEVAHIENVMATESRGREHRRLRRTEETFTIEREHSEESQRDLQTTERFELQHEVQKTIKQETKFEVGAEVSAGFGPVQIGVNTSFSTSKSKTESDRKATEYAKEITEKAVSKIVDRVREERTTKTIEEFEEKNFHNFANTDGDNKSGIYRWVDKYYRAKVVNYGKRLFYEFIVPEPAAFYIFAQMHNININLLPTEPIAPLKPGTKLPLSPGDVSPSNYLSLVRDYDAQGVRPPPRQVIKLTRIMARELQPDHFFAFTDSELDIPDGYVRTSTEILPGLLAKDDEWLMSVVTPRGATEYTEGNASGFSNSAKIQGLHPVGVFGRGVRNLVVEVTVTCSRTGEAMNEWRMATYQAIMNAYQQKLLSYQEQLAAAQIQGGVQIGGNNPLFNREIEREELKKSCITLWTGFQDDAVPGISHDLPGAGEPVKPKHFPKPHIANSIVVAPSIKFLEQAFDWANMAYEFYPYYWGRRSQWLQTYTLADPDPLFTDFLQAGAARVLVPVHPVFTAQVLFYQLTGKLWTAAETPPMLDPPDPGGTLVAPGVADNTDAELALYRDYMAELVGDASGDQLDRERDIRPEDPDAWMIKVPTTLVWLQPDAVLPDLDNPEPPELEPEPDDG
ncbi:MAG: hypothetical protein M3O70_05240 [Actinomycetota bacterium]|nr:hypothetical protein [Actinomycetota bacterium]